MQSNKTINKLLKFALIILGIIFIYFLFNVVGGYVFKKIFPYTAGRTGIHCYITDNPHVNITHHIYFKDLESCLKYVERNKDEVD